MIEIAIGLLLIVAVAASLVGVAALLPGTFGIDPLPLLGYGGIAAIAALGLVLVVAGSLRRAIARNAARRHRLRSTRLALGGSLAVIGLALGPVVAAEAFNLVRISSIPLGYYLAAEGALVGLVAVAFAWAARQARIDAEEPAGD